jgi:hypothetical protein
MVAKYWFHYYTSLSSQEPCVELSKRIFILSSSLKIFHKNLRQFVLVQARVSHEFDWGLLFKCFLFFLIQNVLTVELPHISPGNLLAEQIMFVIIYCHNRKYHLNRILAVLQKKETQRMIIVLRSRLKQF